MDKHIIHHKQSIIAIPTACRSEWGVLQPLVYTLYNTPGIQLDLLVAGSHNSPAYDNTHAHISRDYKHITYHTLLDSDTAAGVSKTMALTMLSFTDYFTNHRPDIIIIEGDRYEMLAIATVAYNHNIPIAHISGGDMTTGSMDNAYRDCISTMSTLHFPDTYEASAKLHLRGYTRVYPYGSISLHGITPPPANSPRHNCILALHPASDITPSIAVDIYKILLDYGWNPWISTPCPDADGKAILSALKSIAPTSQILGDMQRDKFLELLSSVECIVGNSSAGIVEAPALCTPTINIGSRQKGRPQASSIINCNESTKDELITALKKLDTLAADIAKRGVDLIYTDKNTVAGIANTVVKYVEYVKRM